MRLTYVTDPDYRAIRRVAEPAEVRWKGFSEKLTVEIEDQEVLFHRRIVFNFTGNINDLPTRKMIFKPTLEMRDAGRDMCYGVSDSMTKLVAGFVFDEPSMDGMVHGKINRGNVRVVEDKFNSYGGRGGSSKVITQKFWNALPSSIRYDPKAPGEVFAKASMTADVKAVYVLDVFRLGLPGNKVLGEVGPSDVVGLKQEAGMDVDAVPFPRRVRPNAEKKKEADGTRALPKARVMSEMNVYWYNG